MKIRSWSEKKRLDFCRRLVIYIAGFGLAMALVVDDSLLLRARTEMEPQQPTERQTLLLMQIQTLTQPQSLAHHPTLQPRPQVQPQAQTLLPESSETWISGVWLHPGMFGPDKKEAISKMRRTLDEYAQAGLNTLIMLVKDTSGYVYFQSEIGVRDPAYDWDFFTVFLEEARKRNMAVHPWFCVFPEGALVGQVRERPDWLISGPRGEMVRTVNPALPAARAYEISLMTELVKKYEVDWIHLDYIRFPCEPVEPYFSYDAKTLKLFKEETGIDFSSLKARDSGNPHWNVWLEWNRQQVTTFIQELKGELAATGRQVKISAAIFPDADNARVLIGQDWARWVELGLVDMLCPMLYTNDTALFDRLTKRAVTVAACALAPEVAASESVGVEVASGTQPEKICSSKSETKLWRKVLVCPGVGIGTSHNQSNPEIMMKEIGLARAAGADGVIFFSGSSLTASFLEKIRMLAKVEK
ncbi:MAG: family 10 glycosylhydrolase [Acidobacteriota bacterium]|nr:family 10 glycosylhydrolase [Acidobacteriota bacterium]